MNQKSHGQIQFLSYQKIMPQWVHELKPIFIAIIPALIIAFFTAKWATNRAFQLKWWEKKEQAYSQVIESLSVIEEYLSFMFDYERDVIDEEKIDTIKLKKDHDKAFSKAMNEIGRSKNIGGFIFSPESLKTLEKLRVYVRDAKPSERSYEEYGKVLFDFRKDKEKFIKCAKKDLKVKY